MPLFVLLVILLLMLKVLYACCLVFWEALDNASTQENDGTGTLAHGPEVSV